MEKGKKKSIIIYLDIREMLRCLPAEEVGKLWLAVLDYAADGVYPDFKGGLNVAFTALRAQIDRDTVKYEDRCKLNSENAVKRWNKT